MNALVIPYLPNNTRPILRLGACSCGAYPALQSERLRYPIAASAMPVNIDRDREEVYTISVINTLNTVYASFVPIAVISRSKKRSRINFTIIRPGGLTNEHLRS